MTLFTNLALVNIINLCFSKSGHSPADLTGIKLSEQKTCARRGGAGIFTAKVKAAHLLLMSDEEIQ